MELSVWIKALEEELLLNRLSEVEKEKLRKSIIELTEVSEQINKIWETIE